MYNKSKQGQFWVYVDLNEHANTKSKGMHANVAN